jgi:hypothetical protein
MARALLASERRVEVVGHARHGREALVLVPALQPDAFTQLGDVLGSQNSDTCHMHRALRIPAAGLLVFAASACGSSGVRNGVRVPNLEGMRADIAVARINDAGLCVAQVKVDATAPQPEGQVFRQTPKAGSVLPRNGDVTLTQSSVGGSGNVIQFPLRPGCHSQNPPFVVIPG